MLEAVTSSAKERERNEKWPDSVKQLAFEVWLHQAGRNIKATETTLATEFDSPVAGRTIRDWRDQDQWDVKAEEQMRLIVGSYHERTLGQLVVAAYHSASYLARVTSGAEKGDRERLRAAMVSLQSAGYGAYSQRSSLPAAIGGGEDGDIASLDRASLIDRERQRRGGG